jgi:hypothetical protein
MRERLSDFHDSAMTDHAARMPAVRSKQTSV